MCRWFTGIIRTGHLQSPARTSRAAIRTAGFPAAFRGIVPKGKIFWDSRGRRATKSLTSSFLFPVSQPIADFSSLGHKMLRTRWKVWIVERPAAGSLFPCPPASFSPSLPPFLYFVLRNFFVRRALLISRSLFPDIAQAPEK